MKQVLIKQGQIVVEEVPTPKTEPGTLLVRVDHSCISAGTELGGLDSQAQPLWKRALKNPRAVKSTLQSIASHGLAHTRNRIEGKLAEGKPTGYSATGTVIEIGSGIEGFRPGDRVACAGAQCAHHAEVIRVPRNLAVHVPNQLDFSFASTVTLGAIALQGVRRAQPTLGETFVVIGLGILGQITCQMLKSNGCRVIGTDKLSDRISLAQELGINYGINTDDAKAIDQVMLNSGGMGADGVIITASSPSHEVVQAAFNMCRRKGRVVLVGDVGLNLNRADFYQKELDFFISTSYGPGRYDKNYEEEGIDYPVGYVRWTENRNMEEYLRMLAEKKIQLKPLISSTYEINNAPKAYEALKNSGKKSLIVLLRYPKTAGDQPLERVLLNPAAKPGKPGKINLAVVGAGAFAKGMHIPNLQSMTDRFHIHAVASRTGHNASNTANQLGAKYSTTDYNRIVRDDEVDAVIISTRHDLHATMALEALKAGKHVLLEKPLALAMRELASIKAFFDEKSAEAPVLLTGFNRRFSPFAQRIKELVNERSNPMIMNYRMNAGHIPLDHWVHSAEGGGRNIGEACHIYDLFTFFTDSKVLSVNANSISPSTNHYSPRDNFQASMKFEDGSIANLTYTALGTNEYPKENLEVFVDGKVMVLNDYKSLKVYGLKNKNLDKAAVDKGHQKELEVFADAIQKGGEWPIPLWQQIQATEISFEVENLLNKNR